MAISVKLILGLLAVNAIASANPLATFGPSKRDSCPPSLVSDYIIQAKPTPIKNHVCNTRGTVKQPTGLYSSCTSTDQTACRNTCFSDPQCKAFGFSNSTLACQLYSKPLEAQMFRATPNKPANLVFWSTFCYTKTCPQPSAVSVINGDFEDTGNQPYPGDTNPYDAAYQCLNWTASDLPSYHIEQVYGPGATKETAFGIDYQEVYGPITFGDEVSWFQTLSGFTPGAAYTLSFNSAAISVDNTGSNRPDLPVTMTIAFSLGDETYTFNPCGDMDTCNSGRIDPVYQAQSATFTPNAETMVLKFGAYGPSGAQVFLDTFVMTPVERVCTLHS